MYNYLINMRRLTKVAIVLCVDVILVLISFFLALALRLNQIFPVNWFIDSLATITIMIFATIAFTFFLRLHLKKLATFDLRSANDLIILIITVTAITFLFNIYFNMGAPRTTPLIAGAVLFIALFGVRIMAVNLLRMLELMNSDQVAVAIYGAGSAGTRLALMLRNSKEYKPVLFVDDNPRLQGLNISGLRVYAPSRLEGFIAKGRISEILLAIPSIKPNQRRKIVQSLSEIGCKVQEVPTYEEVIKSGDLLKSLRVIKPEELLGRNTVEIEMAETIAIYKNANVLVSGGGGSIGSELCRKIMKLRPKRLVIFEISEFSLYSIEKELAPFAHENGVELIPTLGSVNDEKLLTKLFKQYKIGVVLHAAAYKHVPLVEANSLEGIRNNIFGTKIIAEVAIANNVRSFTLISTDKAVRPTSIMGASKRVAELVLQDLHQQGSSCIFSMVRFGNVLGSSGSVIPLFRHQIERGGPLTITHKDVTRYFMTTPEAAELVLLASSFAEGGEVFVLDMGEPVKIIDLARRMIELSGLSERTIHNPKGDIEIKIGTLRPGEKLYEELLIGSNMLFTPHPKILCARESLLSSAQMQAIYADLEKSLAEQNTEDARNVLFSAIEKCDAI